MSAMIDNIESGRAFRTLLEILSEPGEPFPEMFLSKTFNSPTFVLGNSSSSLLISRLGTVLFTLDSNSESNS